ncbi:MAG: hypothetical protein QOC81_1676 [Thermoanaerobaculia bacterium]|jgi:hypothetical protein|nr:hypothetical protein [Thermoanaerobaculia bacterium]
MGRDARRLLFEAFGTVLLIRAGLWLLPFRVVHRAVASRAARAARGANRPVDQIVWAVETAARRVPRASCLTQAMAGTVMLAAHGHEATLRVGVARNELGEMRAHAWIESEGRTILGDPRAGTFVALPPLAFPR